MSSDFARIEVHLAIIDRDVAPVMQRYREHIQCRRGCSRCCAQTFSVSALEGDYLRHGLARLPAEARDDILARARTYRPGDPCPVLASDGACRLYAHRPRICRKYGIPLWHPDRPDEVRTCELNFRDVVDIDADLILEPQAEWARDWIRLREDAGDPRPAATIAEHLRTTAEPTR